MSNTFGNMPSIKMRGFTHRQPMRSFAS